MPANSVKTATNGVKEGDKRIIRDLVKEYLEICNDPVQEERKERWKGIHALESEEPAVLTRPFLMMHEADEVHDLKCESEEMRGIEKGFRQNLFLSKIGDDAVFEPFYKIGAAFKTPETDLWGIPMPGRSGGKDTADNVYEDAPIKTLEDAQKLRAVSDEIDEEKTAEKERWFQDLFGDLITIDVERKTRYARSGRAKMIAPDLTFLRGMTQLMLDMHDNPEWLHSILAFMRDTILDAFEKAEQAGTWKLSDSMNQAMSYARELPDPAPNTPAEMGQLWNFFHAQEYTLVSPDMHEEFGLRYQKPIMEKFGLTAYGCCEDLTEKIDMLREVSNLRRIAVTPRADVVKCAEQIGRDFTISWRPNPADMVCCGFDENKIERELTKGVEALKGRHYDITLKDVITVENDVTRLPQWVNIARRVIDKVHG